MQRYISISLVASLVLVFAGLPQQALAQPEDGQLKNRLELIRKQIQDLKEQEARLQQQLKQQKIAEAEREKQYLKIEARGMLDQKRKNVPFRPAAVPGAVVQPEKVWLLRIRDTLFEVTMDEQNKELLKQCEQLNGQPVIVKGTLKSIGPTAPFPGAARGVIRLESINAAPEVQGTPDDKAPPRPKTDTPPRPKKDEDQR